VLRLVSEFADFFMLKKVKYYQMHKFLFLKQERSVYIALLNSNKIAEAITAFENYRNNLAKYKPDKNEKEEYKKERTHSVQVFIDELASKLEEFINKSDYPSASLCSAYLFRFNKTDKYLLKNYIKCLYNLRQYDLAFDILNHFIDIYPDDFTIYELYAEVCHEAGENIKAVEYYKKYLSVKKSENITAEEYNWLGFYYDVASSDDCYHEYLEKALEYYIKAAEMKKYNKIFNKNVTIIGFRAKQYDLIKKYWERLLKYHVLNSDDKYDYALYCMKTCNFKEGKKYYDARFRRGIKSFIYPRINKPVWNGENISKKTLLVHSEQGFGDVILTSGYINRLKKLANKIIYVVPRELLNLMKYNFNDIDVYPAFEFDINHLEFDYHIPVMSIPFVLELNRDTISVGEGFLHVNDELIKLYKNKYFNNEKVKVGISFHGHAGEEFKWRSLPYEYVPFLDKLKNAQLYNFNPDVDINNFSGLKNNHVINIAESFRDFSDTAAAIENCDVILATDNCILNLAGALGKKTFALFNWDSEYRWFDLTGENTVWLTSVKPFVNKKINEWEYSLNNAINEINSTYNNC